MEQLQNAIPFIGILLLFPRITTQLIPQQYHLINHSLTWYEAQSYCRVKYTDLATVNNMDDKNSLVNTLGSHVTNSWIGLQKGGASRWMWSDGSGRAQFTKWSDGEPNNVAGNEQCVEMSETGSWNDIPCEEIKGYVCYERDQDGKRRYVYYSGGRSWVNSQDLCRSKRTDMADVRSETENSRIVNLAKTWLPNKVWIGLFRDTWMWSDGRETSFRYWLRDSHSWGDCASVAVSQQGRWVETQCNQKATFVCQGGLKVKKMVIRIKVRSGVDLTDSTVSSTLLKKLEISLKHQSVTDFKLTWQNDKGGHVFQRQQVKVAEKKECSSLSRTANVISRQVLEFKSN